MTRLNVLRALETLDISSDLHANAHRLLITLETPESDYYNPYGASIIRRLLSNFTKSGRRRNKKRDHIIVLFLGQIESLLLSTTSSLSTNQDITQMLNPSINRDMNTRIPRITINEIIDSLLYGRSERKIYAIENYYPSVSIYGTSGLTVIHSALTQYLNSTPDIEIRKRKLNYILKKTEDSSIDDNRKIVSNLIAFELKRRLNETPEKTGESFDRIFRRLSSNRYADSELVDRCINARNSAVHDGLARCGNDVLKFYLILLFNSMAAKSNLDKVGVKKIEPKVKKEVAKDHASILATAISGSILGVALIALVSYYVAMFVVGSYIGESDANRLRWDPLNHQFNARMNEIIATKDTVQLLKVQKDLIWIEDNLLNQPEKASQQ